MWLKTFSGFTGPAIKQQTIMKKVKFIYKTLAAATAVLCMSGCEFDPAKKDIAKVEEKLVVTSSSGRLVLEEDTLQDAFITFDWNEARKVHEDHVVTYTTKLDVVGKNFGSSITNIEEDGIFSRTFTAEQINTWANEKWFIPVNTVFYLEFRVSVQFEGGPTYEYPEVRTVEVEVIPIEVYIFDADKVFLSGTAIGAADIEISRTLENKNQFAWIGELNAGTLQIPVEYEGATKYICSAAGDGTLQDGIAEDVVMQEMADSWNIPAAGTYRIVINMDKTTVTIYSAATDLQPASVEWQHPDTGMVTTVVTKLWKRGSQGWDWRDADITQSLADPQVFVYSSSTGFTGSAQYGVAGHNNNYVYTAATNGLSATYGQSVEMVGGSSGTERNSYYSLGGTTRFVVIDIRNMKITFYDAVQ